MSSQSLTPSAAPVSTLSKPRSVWKDIINCFRSVQLAVVLLSLLAIGTILGVVMPQIGTAQVSDIQRQFGSNYELLHSMGLFNVFSSFWYLTLQILFFFNLLIGSFKWLKPATLAAIEKTFFLPEQLMQHMESHSLSSLAQGNRETVENKVSQALKKFRYRIYKDGQGNLYACKGNITRLGPCMAHLGILLCLVAGVYSNFTGFKALQMVIPGDTFNIQDATTFKTGVPRNLWVGSIPDLKIHVSEFHVIYYPDHPQTAKQYFSKIQVLSPTTGKVLKAQTISVNHPLRYGGLSIYQASFAPTGRFQIKVNGKPMMISTNSQFNNRPISISPLKDGSMLIMFPFFAHQDPGIPKNVGIFFVRKPGQPFVKGRMPENLRLFQGETGTLNGETITYVKPEIATGLQIKKAPEVPLMYLAYLIISAGTILCFFSQRRLWVSLRENAAGKYEIMLYPKTNKGRLSFRRELFSIETALTKIFAPQPLKE